ncbi:NECA3 protein, partial [Pachycephala philippinensis]|nr:NECA3 protein [Pachycephala philippinensis]
MSCAELLAVCLLSADRGPKPHRQPLPIFHDVNDGKLSFEEFKNYFSDGILSSEELWELFSGIDRRHSDNVDTEKLCGKSGDVPPQDVCDGVCVCLPWAGLAAIDLSVPESQHRDPLPCPQRYETSSKMEQFLTRFLLRETMHQLQSLQASLECAVDTVEEQAGRARKEIKKSETSVSLRSGRRCGRRGQKNVCLSPTDPYSGMLTTGTCCPSGWLCPAGAGGGVGLAQNHRNSKGEKISKIKSNHSPSTAKATTNPCPQVPHPQQHWALRASPEWSLEHLTQMPAGASACAGAVPACPGSLCPHSVSACKLTDEACFILYEFWQDVSSWRSHLQSSCSKTFQQSILSLLESPELLTTMLFPASWWIMNNN